MADIVRAIELEKEYVNKKIKGEIPFVLIDAIKKCGFRSFEEYFDTKKRYQFRELEFVSKDITQAEIVPEILTVLENGTIGVWFIDSIETCVFSGNQGLKDYNKDYCIENNITVYPLLSGGGAIVHQYGDFSFGVSCPESIHMDAVYLLNRISKLIQKYTDKTVEVDGNDILVDGKKVCGSTTYCKNGLFLFIAYFSFNDKTELIDIICNKETTKRPSYIDFMTRDELRQEVAKWLRLTST